MYNCACGHVACNCPSDLVRVTYEKAVFVLGFTSYCSFFYLVLGISSKRRVFWTFTNHPVRAVYHLLSLKYTPWVGPIFTSPRIFPNFYFLDSLEMLWISLFLLVIILLTVTTVAQFPSYLPFRMHLRLSFSSNWIHFLNTKDFSVSPVRILTSRLTGNLLFFASRSLSASLDNHGKTCLQSHWPKWIQRPFGEITHVRIFHALRTVEMKPQ